MVELNKIDHDTNLANVSITRFAETRNTRYEISPGLAPCSPAISYQVISELRTQEAIRRLNANNADEER